MLVADTVFFLNFKSFPYQPLFFAELWINFKVRKLRYFGNLRNWGLQLGGYNSILLSNPRPSNLAFHNFYQPWPSSEEVQILSYFREKIILNFFSWAGKSFLSLEQSTIFLQNQRVGIKSHMHCGNYFLINFFLPLRSTLKPNRTSSSRAAISRIVFVNKTPCIKLT